jgi:hypothetical protein
VRPHPANEAAPCRDLSNLQAAGLQSARLLTGSLLELDPLEQHEAVCTLVSVDIGFGTPGDHLLVQGDVTDIV